MFLNSSLILIATIVIAAYQEVISDSFQSQLFGTYFFKKLRKRLVNFHSAGEWPNSPLIKLDPCHVVRHTDALNILREQIRQGLDNLNGGGVAILAAPQGSGKSTYLADALMKHYKTYPWWRQLITKKVLVLTGESCLEKLTFKRLLGMDPHDEVSKCVPDGSTIVIDQVDVGPAFISTSMTNFVTELATNSKNRKSYFVIIVVSNSEVYKTLLRCNGGEKVFSFLQHDNTSWLKWTPPQVKEFIAKKCSNKKLVDELSALCGDAVSPKPVKFAIEIAMRCVLPNLSHNDKRQIKAAIHSNNLAWKPFDDFK